MTQTTLDSLEGFDPQVIKRRPTDIESIYGQSRGGIAPQPAILNRPYRQDFNNMVRVPDKSNDTLIQRRRMYVYRNANATQAGLSAGDLSWTAAGVAKSLPTTRFNRNIRPLVGGGQRDMWGQHTNIETGKGTDQLVGRPRMKPAGTNRLTVQRYRGQSYSQTTVLAGN